MSAKQRGKAKAKSGGKSGAPPGDKLVPQPHGGALKQGGEHERPGRPKDATRELLRGLLRDKVAPNAVRAVAASTDGDLHLRAVDVFARVSEGKVEEVTVVSDDVRTRLLRQVEVITRLLPAEQAGPLLRELEAVWS